MLHTTHPFYKWSSHWNYGLPTRYVFSFGIAQLNQTTTEKQSLASYHPTRQRRRYFHTPYMVAMFFAWRHAALKYDAFRHYYKASTPLKFLNQQHWFQETKILHWSTTLFHSISCFPLQHTGMNPEFFFPFSTVQIQSSLQELNRTLCTGYARSTWIFKAMAFVIAVCWAPAQSWQMSLFKFLIFYFKTPQYSHVSSHFLHSTFKLWNIVNELDEKGTWHVCHYPFVGLTLPLRFCHWLLYSKHFGQSSYMNITFWEWSILGRI